MGDNMGKLFVIGIGPGNPDSMTFRAANALECSEVIFGYTPYLDLLQQGPYAKKEMVSTGMTEELSRCRLALASASSGKTAAMVCSGDAGIYGLASPVLELAPDYPDVEIEIIPGVSAAMSGAALLGAPLGHDFCVISLSDRLTDWNTIENRLRIAAEGDFVICLYNPGSRHRKDVLQRACHVLLEKKAGSTYCALAKNIGREGEEYEILSLHNLSNRQADMFTTVYIGSSQTKEIQGRLVTPRGYRI